MATFNRPVASSSTTITQSEKVRQLWKAFERSIPNGKNVMEHRVTAAKAKADMEYSKMPNHLRVSSTEHEQMKTKSVNKIKETYYDDVKVQWDTKLKKAGLKAEDWTDMTAEEMDAIATILNGGVDASSDEDLVVVKNSVPLAPLPQTYSNYYRPIAPSFSTSTRTSNVSSISTASTASSYAVVNPNEFHSGEEDDYFYPVTATSHDLTSDDDEGATSSHHRGNPFGGWSSGGSLVSSMHNSVESLSSAPFPRPLVSNYIQNTSHTRLTTTTNLSEDENGQSSSFKTKVRQPYIGPHLEDPNEPLSEADDFELFKMQTRMQKIVEFHQQAALAEIRLSIEIYKDRKTSGGQRKEVSSRVVEHQKQMTMLQKEKEDQRKATVKEERSKRRSELRGRPGRSNTIVAPVPSAPTNPSWLNDFQENVSPQLQSNFDLKKLLAEDATQQLDSVEQYLQQTLFDPSTFSPATQSLQESVDYGQGYESSSRNGLAPRWNVSSASLHSFASGSSSQFPVQPQSTRRPASESRKSKGRPSPFGEDSDEDNDEDNSPPADILTQTMNPFTRANAAVADALLESQFQDDPVLAAALSRYSVSNDSRNSPPMPSWGTKPVSQQPSAQSAWAAKEVRATPVASGWARKNQFNNFASQDASSSNSPFGIPEQAEQHSRLSSSVATFSLGRKPMPAEPQTTWEQPEPSPANMSMSPFSFNGKGKKPMSMVAPVEEPQPMWEEPPKKQIPPVAPFATSSRNDPPTPAPAPAVVAPKPGKAAATPAPAPTPAAAPAAPASKKMNKKQRQASKKNSGASTTAEEPEPTPTATQPGVPEPVVEKPQQQQPQPAPLIDEPYLLTHEPTSLISRMMPAIGRVRKDSAPPTPFGWEDSAITTPRPASKVPAHLQTQQEAAGTPRPNLFKKFNTTESVLGGGASASARMSLDQNPTGTIKSSQWGSSSGQATTSNNRSIWNVFGGPSPPTKTSQPATSLFGENNVQIPGGVDLNEHGNDEDDDDGGGEDGGGGGEEEEVVTPQIWKAPTSLWGKKVEKAPAATPAPAPAPAQPQQQQKQQPLSAAAARQRRMSEAASTAATSRNPAAKPPAAAPAAATQPQPIPAALTGKKGARAKKNAKGKKVTMEEVPDEENDSRGGILPVDSKVLLLPANDASPSKVILEPKPSVAPRMFDSIISYGDDDDDEDTFSSPHAATPSTAPSSPPDIFADDARLAAAIKEMQESAARFENLHESDGNGGGGGGGGSGGGGGVWGLANTQQHDRWMPSAMSSASTASKAPVWGQASKDKGKGKMTDTEESPKAPIHNLKRNKPAAGWL